jgi:ATP-dependent Clp protease adaptor protein ClpS
MSEQQSTVATLEETVVEEPVVQTTRKAANADADKKRKRQPRYQVILWNDDDHSFEYVIKMLKQLFAIPVEKGFQMAKDVDANGKVVVLTTTREHAELKRDQIHAFGKDELVANCAGSMSCTIEPLPE